MHNGFIFNHNLCVNCNACSAACIIENGWTIRPRMVYTSNSDALPSLSLTNLSLACNHCEKPVCLEGCPSSAYYRELKTGAIIIDEKKCIGCKYCQWNCPYDAPKLNAETKTIGKCNLCFTALIEGMLPACVNACPTGALDFGELSGPPGKNIPSWFPEKNLNPAIRFTSQQNISPVRVVPENIFDKESPDRDEKMNRFAGEWSLVGFSFLTTISVATVISSLIKGNFPGKFLSLLLIIMAGFISLFHLGKRFRAWRSVTNIKSSPLSREIAVFLIYSAFSFIAVLLRLPWSLIVSSVTGLLLLIIIDSVYIYADRRKMIVMHPGQTFLSALLIVSFLSGIVLPFLFIAVIKLISSVYILYINKFNIRYFEIRFLRIALLIITGASLLSTISYNDPLINYLFLTGELIDRILFYFDFNPVSINTEILKQLKSVRNEKKRN